MSTSAIRDAMEKVRDPAADAVADLKECAVDWRDDLVEHGREARGAVRDAARSARRVASRVGDEVSHGYDVARDYTVRHARDAMSLAQRHPMACVAIAAGLGVLIGGLLLARRTHR